MKIRFLKEMAGMPKGFENEVADAIGQILINRGDAEEVKSTSKKVVEEKEASVVLETKEEKKLSKRKTK